MEGDRSNLPSVPENEYSKLLAEDVEAFQQRIEEGFEAIDLYENFNEMTENIYRRKKLGMKSPILDLSIIHSALAATFTNLIIHVRNHCPPLLQNQHLGSLDSKFTGFNVLLRPGDGGGFYFYKGEEGPSVSHSGLEAAMSSVNKPAVGLLFMEGDKSIYHLYQLPEHDYFDILDENVEGFYQFIDKGLEAIDQDENLNEMTAESYVQKKLCLKSYLMELSLIHNSLADQFANLITKVSKHCPSLLQNHTLGSSVSISPRVTHPKYDTFTGFDVCSKGKESSHSASESSMPSVNKPPAPPVSDDVLKVENTKDHGLEASLSSVNKPTAPPASDDVLQVENIKDHGSKSTLSSVNKPPMLLPLNDDALQAEEIEDLGSESSMSSVNKPAVLPPANDADLKVQETKESGSKSFMSSVNKPGVLPPANYDALKVEEIKDHGSEFSILLEKISNLENEVASLKQKIQSLNVEMDWKNDLLDILRAKMRSQDSLIH